MLCCIVVPSNGLLLRRRPADAAVQVRGPPARGHGALLHRRDGAGRAQRARAALRAQVGAPPLVTVIAMGVSSILT